VGGVSIAATAWSELGGNDPGTHGGPSDQGAAAPRAVPRTPGLLGGYGVDQSPAEKLEQHIKMD
jgi:hypothetical protein